MLFARWTKVAVLFHAIFFVAHSVALAEDTDALHGVVATFKTPDKTDSVLLPNFWLYVPKGQAPTPFLDAKEYSVEMSGFISVDLRGQYAFRAEVSGSVVLEVNGNSVLETAGSPNQLSEPGKTIRLNKGTNAIVARFAPPKEGDAMLRLYWVPRDTLPSLLPDSALTCIPTDAFQHGATLRRGRALFTEFRCAKCHKTDFVGMPELAMDAPAFDSIGDRLDTAWIARWIENPSEQRAVTRMPRLFHDSRAKEMAEQIASFLSTFKSAESAPPAAAPEKEQVQKGQHLFQTLHCGACHNTPGSDERDPARISLGHVRQKFLPGALESFLLNPQAHYTWIRMPNFKLTRDEAENLVAFLNSKAAEPLARSALAERNTGKKLLQTSGCLNCHSLKGEMSELTAKTLGEIARGNLESGCLGPSPSDKAPQFSFDETARKDLRAFLKTEAPSLAKDIPREFALRETELLNCAGCHGKFEGFPGLDILGGKIQPEWSARFIAGQVPYKPRPWLDSRMPAFPARADEIAKGLAMLHGYPPNTPMEPAIDKEMAETGRKLVSVKGFSCISCHAVGETPATQVFESAGINLAYSAERMLKPFFHIWIMNPLAIDPTTKMPVYFDKEGRSQLTDIYDGDGQKQIEAIWQYLRLGSKMPPPPLQ